MHVNDSRKKKKHCGTVCNEYVFCSPDLIIFCSESKSLGRVPCVLFPFREFLHPAFFFLIVISFTFWVRRFHLIRLPPYWSPAFCVRFVPRPHQINYWKTPTVCFRECHAVGLSGRVSPKPIGPYPRTRLLGHSSFKLCPKEIVALWFPFVSAPPW
jgi:hypothetical protein